MVLELIIFATIVISLISLIGVFLLNTRKTTDALLMPLVSLSAGTLLAAAFLDLLPEAIEAIPSVQVFYLALFAILVFFALEKLIVWHHHHSGKHDKQEKAMGYLNLIGDAFHNFFDGAVIAAAFMSSIPLGIATTIAVLIHEIPQEIGDYSLLIYSGFSKAKAMWFNLLSAATAILGALLFYFASSFIENLAGFGLAFAAGMFIYIAVGDVVPELHKEKNFNKSLMQFTFVLLGVALIWLIVNFVE